MVLEAGVVGFEDTGEVKEVKSKKFKKKTGFATLNLSFPVLKGIQKRGYNTPTPIQRKCIPLILEGKDIVAMARTGSGKTAAFLVPLFERLRLRTAKAGARALILSPTRELALQTYRFIKELGKYTDLKATVVLGGDSMDQQFSAIHGNPDILVATPGRFLHLCIEMDLKLNNLEYVVFDEADRLFEMGFGEQLKEIFHRLPDTRQTLLFSATLPKMLVDFAKAGLHEPVLLRLDVDTKIPDRLKLEFLSVRQEEKPAALLCLLNILPNKSQTVVFTATKHHVEYLHMLLDKSGMVSTMIYSDLDPSARKINAAKFQNGNVSVLIVTDIAARGIDIPQLDYVINYHFPSKSKLFVHRVGRCARAGRSGTAFSLVSPDEQAYLIDLHLFLGRPLKFCKTQNEAADTDGLIGKVPQAAVEEQQIEITNWHASYSDLDSMKQVCRNSYTQYIRCRPGASVHSVRQTKQYTFDNVFIHPMFGQQNVTMENNLQFLNRMKKYKPNGTIFELNMSSKTESYSVMKAARKAHQSYIKRAEDKDEDSSRSEVAADNFNDGTELQNTFSQIVTGRKRKGWQGPGDDAPNKRSQYYVPHFAPDRHTEAGLSVNSFANDADKIAFDLTGDSREGIYLQKKLNQKKRKTEENGKKKKIKTESGAWIPATYKSKRYEQWKEKSKIDVDDNDDDDSEGEVNKSTLKKPFQNTHWGRHNRKLAEKLKTKSDVRKPEQILKARLQIEKKRRSSRPNNNKNKNNKNKKSGFRK